MSKNTLLSRLWNVLVMRAQASEPTTIQSVEHISEDMSLPGPQFPLAEPPIALDNDSRIALTVSCRDADSIPRVKDAGQVFVDPETNERVQVMHNGLRVLADGYYGEWMTRLIAQLNGVHEPQEELAFSSILPHISQDAVMIEVGAFWSYYTLWFLLDQPEKRRGIGIEMDPRHIEIGKQNAAMNGLSLDMLQGRIGSAYSPPTEFYTESSGAQTMPTFGLDDVLRETDAKRVDLLLCDAQGGEIDLLAGMKSAVNDNRVGAMVMSTHHHVITGDPLTHQRALAMITDLGGTIRFEHDVSESFSGDGLIVADFDKTLEDWTPPEISRCRASDSLFRNPLYDLAQAMR